MRKSNFLRSGLVTTVLASIVVTAAVNPVIGTSMSVFGQSHQQQSDDVVLLSNKYNRDTISNEVIGEVLNNGTRILDKFEVNINAYFYDSAGVLVGSEQGFIDAQTLSPGDRSAFSVFITDNAIMNEAATYDISINDNRVLEDAPIGSDNESSGDDSNASG